MDEKGTYEYEMAIIKTLDGVQHKVAKHILQDCIDAIDDFSIVSPKEAIGLMKKN